MTRSKSIEGFYDKGSDMGGLADMALYSLLEGSDNKGLVEKAFYRFLGYKDNGFIVDDILIDFYKVVIISISYLYSRIKFI